jgi:hypothetical protein
VKSLLAVLIVNCAVVFWAPNAGEVPRPSIGITLKKPAEWQFSFLAERISELEDTKIEQAISTEKRVNYLVILSAQDDRLIGTRSDCYWRTSLARDCTTIRKIAWWKFIEAGHECAPTATNLICGRCAEIFYFEGHSENVAINILWRIDGAFFDRTVRAIKASSSNSQVSPQLPTSRVICDFNRLFGGSCGPASFDQCFFQGVVSDIEKVGADSGSNEKHESGNAENNGPVRYGAFIAFGWWAIGFVVGLIGLWRLLRHDNAILFTMSLIAAACCGWIGASNLL